MSISDDPFDKPPCRGCSSYLTEPYIKCAECGPSPFLLCLQVSNLCYKCTDILLELLFIPRHWNWTFLLQCFTRGFEYKKHESDHKYEIMVSQIKIVLHTQTLTTHWPVNLSSLLTLNKDVRLPRAGAWMDGTGRDGPVGSSHGLWLWKLVSAFSLVACKSISFSDGLENTLMLWRRLVEGKIYLYLTIHIPGFMLRSSFTPPSHNSSCN